METTLFIVARESYRRKLWISEKGDVPFWGS